MGRALAALGAIVVVSAPARARAEDRKLVFGEGGVGELELRERTFHAGVNAFVEWEAVPEWLELELGASLLAIDGGVELPVELQLKKPFRITPGVELMLGVGPEVLQISAPQGQSTVYGVTWALDLMFWPWRHAGFWIEPSNDVYFRDRATLGVGSTGGVLFGF